MQYYTYVYLNPEQPGHFTYCDMNKADSTLVYDLDHLKIGFKGATIFS